jgi:hypothetical protein
MRSMGGDGLSTTQGCDYRALANPSFSHNSAAGTRRCFGHFFVRAPRVADGPEQNSGGVLWRRGPEAPQLAAPGGRRSATFSPRLDVRDAGSAAAGNSIAKWGMRGPQAA